MLYNYNKLQKKKKNYRPKLNYQKVNPTSNEL